MAKDKKVNKEAEGTDPENNNSDIWFHTNCMEMMKNDEKTTKNLVSFLKSIDYEFPELIIQDESQ